ncbi:outer membrane transport energization protein TonB [Mucilaginibacter lappiensis]|uniref:Protein TonB n=1 Tax=Mucilaginibacter lappiensis TaxID=354630 RepID=A0ABR6PNU6_9SPHI|nr:energy transducer TonB [Mucilaginibacter lappiensis]MBB6111428.1 protein TonB [Mucilaginibacter lappiensis]SIR79055.1 outer membrane transport energization protein TonB [Mucilaginibacter lappiensis]
MFGSKLDILDQKWIDVVFSSRNKAYGAYELRRDNSKNTSRALVIAIIVFVFVVALPTIINRIQGLIPKADQKVKITDVVLLPPPPVDQTKKPPPPPPEPPKPKVDQVRFPPPVVKPDNEVKEKDPPTVKELAVADPGQKDQKGDPNADIRIDEPVGNSDVKQVVEADPNQIFTSVEQVPEFPGGLDKFGAYLGKSIRYPAVARENGTQGRVIVTFVVEKDGSLTDIKVTRGIGSGCDEEAVRVLKNSPKWKPGIQNGRPVRVQYSVPISFTLASE